MIKLAIKPDYPFESRVVLRMEAHLVLIYNEHLQVTLFLHKPQRNQPHHIVSTGSMT